MSHYALDNGIHFALNLPRDRQYLSARCLDDYRQLVRTDELAGEVFTAVTARLIKELDISVKKQRLDSTHILSDMASFGRTKLMGVAVKRFLTALERHVPASHAALDPALRARYEVTQAKLFGHATANAASRALAQSQTAADMHLLIERFAQESLVNTRTTYKALVRIFSEHCEVVEDKVTVRKKGQDEHGGSAHTMQNPSDAGAGYDGHKGSGYQVQLAETSDVSNPVQIVTVCIPQSAAESDCGSMEAAIEEQRKIDALPDELSADTLYGSDANAQLCAEHGIDLISPVPGRPPKAKAAEAPEPATQEAAKSAERSAQPNAQPNAGTGHEPPASAPQPSEGKAQRIEQRREREQSEEWQEKYRRRAGIESLNRALDRVTGIKNLRVRGLAAVSHAVYSKVSGWNIHQAARAAAIAARQARNEAKKAALAAAQALLRACRALVELIRGSVQPDRGLHAVRSITPRICSIYIHI